MSEIIEWILYTIAALFIARFCYNAAIDLYSGSEEEDTGNKRVEGGDPREGNDFFDCKLSKWGVSESDRQALMLVDISPQREILGKAHIRFIGPDEEWYGIYLYDTTAKVIMEGGKIDGKLKIHVKDFTSFYGIIQEAKKVLQSEEEEKARSRTIDRLLGLDGDDDGDIV